MKNFYAPKPFSDDPLDRVNAAKAIKNMIFIKENFIDLNPLMFAEATISKDYCDKTHLSTAYGTNIFYVIDGSCMFSLNGTECVVKKGDFFITPKGSYAMLYLLDDSEMHHSWISFDGTLAFDFSQFPSVFTLPQHIVDRLHTPDEKTRNLGSRLTSDLFLIHGYMKEQTIENPSYVQKVIDYISVSYMDKISVADIAATVNLDRYYLSKLFKAEMNMSIQDYLVQFRIVKSQLYLKHNFTVTDAARLCGFNDRSNFTKAFTREIGISPAQWVKLMKKDPLNGPQ